MKILNHFDQGTQEWLMQRCGKITMSHAKELTTKGRGETRNSYINSVIAEALSGIPSESINTYDMMRGTFYEEYARKAVEVSTGLEIETVGFVEHDNAAIGCSPDGLINRRKGVEIKCPAPKEHINIINKGIKKYIPQMQGGMWILDYDSWVFASFCPDVKECPLYLVEVVRDDGMIKEISDSSIMAAEEVTQAVNKIKKLKNNDAVCKIANDALLDFANAVSDKHEVII